jgi:hypothetical protein
MGAEPIISMDSPGSRPISSKRAERESEPVISTMTAFCPSRSSSREQAIVVNLCVDRCFEVTLGAQRLDEDVSSFAESKAHFFTFDS